MVYGIGLCPPSHFFLLPQWHSGQGITQRIQIPVTVMTEMSAVPHGGIRSHGHVAAAQTAVYHGRGHTIVHAVGKKRIDIQHLSGIC